MASRPVQQLDQPARWLRHLFSLAIALLLSCGSSIADCVDADGDGFLIGPACGTPQDCNDAASAIHPGAPELCDGIDNDCTGAVDDAPFCARTCDAPVWSGEPLTFQGGVASLAWSGETFALVWQDDRDGDLGLFVAAFDSAGVQLGGELRLGTDAGDSVQPAVIWNGAEFAVLWGQTEHDDPNRTRQVYFARVDQNGAPVGEPTRLTDGPDRASVQAVAWSGRQYAFVFIRGDFFWLGRFDSSGTRIGGDVQLAPWAAQERSSVVPGNLASLFWNGDVYGFLWHEQGGDSLFFTRLDSMGQRVDGDSLIATAGGFSISELVWSGSEFALSFVDFGASLQFVRLDASGREVGRTEIYRSGWTIDGPRLVWTGAEYGLVFYEFPFDAQIARLDPRGEILGDLIPWDYESAVTSPSLVWTGEDYGLALRLATEGPSAAYFSKLGCGCVDSDGDGFSNCAECDDGLAVAYPGASEICDDIDNDCNEIVDDDGVPPTIIVQASPDRLWPPNHRLVAVRAAVSASDACGDVRVTMTSIEGDEADDVAEGGDGSTTDDIQEASIGTADFEFLLRAERDGTGTGRTYTVSYVATDDEGERSLGTAVVVVEHDRGGGAEPLELSVEQTEARTRVRWSEVPGADSYDVVRGALHNLRIVGPAIDLGPLSCVESRSSDTSTSGWEETANPEPGEAYFYLVQYWKDVSSSYGTESAPLPRSTAGTPCD